MKPIFIRGLSGRALRFLRDENGSGTILALFFLLIGLIIGGLGIDFNRVMAQRSRLQIATDTAAHAALYTREEEDVTAARNKATETVASMLPEAAFGSTALTTTDVTFGHWNAQDLSFTEDNDSKTAVRVRAAMTETRANASRNLLLHIIGFDTFDLGVESVYSTYFPSCFTEGFVAEGVVNIRSNNSFSDGFCIHSNEYVSLNQNNYFEPGTVVSMPNLDDLDMPNSGFEKNEGLQTALRSGAYRLRLLSDLPDIIDSFWTAEAKHLPPYVIAGSIYEVSENHLAVEPEVEAETGTKGNGNGNGNGNNGGGGNGLTPNHFEPYSVNVMNCSGSGKITLKAGTYSNFLFISDCEVKFSNGVILEDVVMATTNTSASSFNTPSGLSIGRDDNCLAGGGASLMTLGGFHAASSLNIFGGQILALGDIEFAANADGIQGASLVSYGRIEGTSNMNMGYCRSEGMENAYRADYFRMVN
ncbi:pilus assembly protein TadG-related protein [Sulfitobacter aestuarii]|uniref:Pilus assembly protein TadG-related protein n=1 Tax=Sulfitobacter aestuarii TaxID=2161676 RepID=A0ABW5U6C9_9RHOB